MRLADANSHELSVTLGAVVLAGSRRTHLPSGSGGPERYRCRLTIMNRRPSVVVPRSSSPSVPGLVSPTMATFVPAMTPFTVTCTDSVACWENKIVLNSSTVITSRRVQTLVPPCWPAVLDAAIPDPVAERGAADT